MCRLQRGEASHLYFYFLQYRECSHYFDCCVYLTETETNESEDVGGSELERD